MSPLDTFAAHHDAIILARDAVEHHGYFTNPLHMAARLALVKDGVKAEVTEAALHLHWPTWTYSLPLVPDKKAFYGAIAQAYRKGRLFDALPQWMLDGTPLGKMGVVGQGWVEYFTKTTDIQTYAGGRFGSTRNLINKLHRLGTVRSVNALSIAPADRLALFDLWVAQMEAGGQVVNEKGQMHWLAKHWEWVASRFQGATGIGIMLDDRLVALNFAARLSQTHWCCAVEKFDRTVPGANHLAFQQQALLRDAEEQPFEQDGTGEFPDQRHEGLNLHKNRISHHVVTPWRMKCR